MAAKYRFITPCSASGSSASPRAVDSVTSQKTIVTIFRLPGGGAAAASSVPQARQNRARSGFVSPHDGQTITHRV